MIRYGPIFCVFLLMISAIGVKKISDIKRVHQLSGSVFMLSFFLMFFYLLMGSEVTIRLPVLGKIFYSQGNVLMLFIFYLVILLIIWFSYYALKVYIHISDIPLYYQSFFMMNAGITLIAISQNMWVLFLAYIMVIYTSFQMIRIRHQKIKKRNFLMINALGGLFTLVGLLMMMIPSHTSDLASFNQYVSTHLLISQNYFTLSLTLCVIGLGIFGLLFPFFSWMPELFYKTPATLSALLSSVTIKAAPIILIKVILNGFGLDNMKLLHIDVILIFLGVSGMIAGSLIAIRQKDLKKLLAYSTISQMGYIYLALGLGNDYGIRIAFYQIMAHALTKSSLYLATSSIFEQMDTTELGVLRGVGKEMPGTLTCFAIGSLSIVGIPLFAGFVTKWNILLSTLDKGSYLPLIAVLISSVLNAAYYFPIIINAFYGSQNIKHKIFASKAKPVKEVMPLMVLVTGLLAYGFYANRILQMISLYSRKGGI